MLSTSARLQTRRPSPTTAEFTVTTLRPLPAPLHTVLLVARLLLSLATALLLHARYALSPLADRAPALLRAPAYLRSPAGRAVASIAERVPVPVLLPAAAALLWLLSRRGYACESLLVMRGLGVQTSESSASYLATTATRFIPTEKIRDILVNEAFRGFEVRYYLVVVVDGEEDVVVVFPGLLPRLKIVEEVWRGARGCLYEGRGEEKGLIS
ncbi:GPI-GlcNAc transferase complex, PIG-H component-domain-containing protein [Dactylonectria macrodidyma]|uniref:GPI-GlcNAc transferase complex, PIG-H component-domain-containing protein n=1 Tax=Dactylonectria macrodidyma TaxID=307937 RepID=A0A9P9EW48_9HYPO|nr:GPI-GlcNAc transferase complex, PIG-H component-domain-containing protein [Dactylonectria macrodidyma]